MPSKAIEIRQNCDDSRSDGPIKSRKEKKKKNQIYCLPLPYFRTQ